jgi:uncharacterized membrane protein
MGRALSIAVAAVGTALVLAYPLLVLLGLSRLGVRTLGLVLLALLVPVQLLRLRGERRRHLAAVLPLPLAIAAILVVGAVVEDHRFILVLPVAINVALLAGFGLSLRGPVSMIERFARMQVDDLSGAEVAYCRRVTALWCAFFGLNALATLALALAAPLRWWAFWSGGLVSVIMGLLFTVEYLERKRRFRRFGPAWHDRLLARVFRQREHEHE